MTSPTDVNDTGVRKVVTVNAPIELAFEVFTKRFDTWWPRTHRVAEVEMAEAVIDERAGGRWYERGVELTHSELDRHGESWRRLRDGISSEGGWPWLLDAFAETVAKETGQ